MPRRRSEHDGDWTRRYQRGDYDAGNAQRGGHDSDDAHPVERFSRRSKFAQQMKMRRTAEMRTGGEAAANVDALPIGEVIQVHSVYVEVLSEEQTYLCVGRRTQQRLDSSPVVGDQVRIRKTASRHESGLPEAVIERILDRQTLLLRQDSFRKDLSHALVANAAQMMIVASILQPRVKWGLVDRMLIAAESGGLSPIICLNKIDLAEGEAELLAEADEILNHYQTLGVKILRTSCNKPAGLEALYDLLKDNKTVLAGHSGVGKSSLIRAIAPNLDIRVGAVSTFNEKGMHTTSSAQRHLLPFGGQVIDTPGIKQFGLVDVSPDSLISFFPDVEAETAPVWRQESYERILDSL